MTVIDCVCPSLDKELRSAKLEADTLRGKRNSVSKSIGMMMAQKKIEEANKAKQEVVEINERLVFLEKEEERLHADVILPASEQCENMKTVASKVGVTVVCDEEA